MLLWSNIDYNLLGRWPIWGFFGNLDSWKGQPHVSTMSAKGGSQQQLNIFTQDDSFKGEVLAQDQSTVTTKDPQS